MKARNHVSTRTRVLVGMTAMLLPVLVASPTAVAETDHCTDHSTEVKVQSDDSPATVQVVDTRTGDLVEVVVTISGIGFTIEATDPDIDLVDASWCIKSSTNTNDGTGLSGESTSTNRQGRTQAISYVVVYSVTSDEPAEPCDTATNSGGAGVTETSHQLGVAGPTAFVFDWEAFFIPDRFEVLYEGVVIFDTGVTQHNGSAVVAVPDGTETTVTVRVTGPGGTLWQYVVNCPAPTS